MPYLVSYFRIKFHKINGTVLPAEVEYGALADSLQEAEHQARHIVRTATPTRSCMLLPRVLPFDGELIDAMYEAQEQAEAIINRMNESIEVMEQAETIRKSKRR